MQFCSALRITILASSERVKCMNIQPVFHPVTCTWCLHGMRFINICHSNGSELYCNESELLNFGHFTYSYEIMSNIDYNLFNLMMHFAFVLNYLQF